VELDVGSLHAASGGGGSATTNQEPEVSARLHLLSFCFIVRIDFSIS
jgi:hypothetical protein